MNRNKNLEAQRKDANHKSYRGKRSHRKDRQSKPERYDGDKEKLEAEGRNNDPNYYFLDRNVASQVSQLSFQTIGGVVTNYRGTQLDYPNVKVQYWNPSPMSGTNPLNTDLLQRGINMAGLRMFTKLSAFTGRQAVYGPQDLSIMILALGEVISVMEWCRRAFGVAFLGSEYNRTYPRTLLKAMRINDVDFYPNYAAYRNRFNKLVTLVNQIPIPGNVAYFDKCAHMYEKIYVDAQSPLATAIVDNIATTWVLNETVYSGGTILQTCSFTVDKSDGSIYSLQNFSYYLDWAEFLINAMLNSSTLQVVYTDILNLSTKLQTKFWKFDYLIDGYMVVPEYNTNYLLQMHNSNIVGCPTLPALDTYNTPLNDVYPDASNNALWFNPAFKTFLGVNNTQVSGWIRSQALLDCLTPEPSVEDRIEMIRWVGLSTNQTTKISDVEYEHYIVLPDHYIVCNEYYNAGLVAVQVYSNSVYGYNNTTDSFKLGNELKLAGLSSKVDWDCLYDHVNSSFSPVAFYGMNYGDLNFYTVVDANWLKPIFDFTSLALYDAR